MIRPYQGAREKSVDFARYYEEVARELGCDFLDAGALVDPNDEDGVHLDQDAHRILGEAIAARIREMI